MIDPTVQNIDTLASTIADFTNGADPDVQIEFARTLATMARRGGTLKKITDRYPGKREYTAFHFSLAYLIAVDAMRPNGYPFCFSSTELIAHKITVPADKVMRATQVRSLYFFHRWPLGLQRARKS